jgi:hypothetical protein
MDRYEKWTGYLVDLGTLYTTWAQRTGAGLKNTRRQREINTVCLFTLCLENNEGKRFLIGIQRRGLHTEPVLVNQLFNDRFGEIEDCDVILVPDLGPEGPSERDVHRLQLVSFVGQVDGDTTALIQFIETKKLRVRRDDDLMLVVHLEQAMTLEYVQLTTALQLRSGGCPYRRIFVLGQIADVFPAVWSCMQVYPRLIAFKDLDGDTARALLADRPTKCGRLQAL